MIRDEEVTVLALLGANDLVSLRSVTLDELRTRKGRRRSRSLRRDRTQLDHIFAHTSICFSKDSYC